MNEVERILQLWTETEAEGKSAVLTTVVRTHGSSYRVPGARLLIAASGRRAGSVSGGCLEDDLIKKAAWLTEAGPVIRRYDTTAEGDLSAGFGLGCQGVIHVLLERLTPGADSVLNVLREARCERRPAAIAHLIRPAMMAGERLTIDPNGRIVHNLVDATLASALEREAKTALSEYRSRTVTLSEDVDAFVEVVTPPVRLLVYGAGDDAVPVTEFAKFLGWGVWVFDARSHYARREKFPQADGVVVRAPGTADGMPLMDPWTAVILMTHSYSQDLDALIELSAARLSYLGILGPRKRTLQLLSDAGLDRSVLTPALHSPMGLDIGGDGPQQVALAVIAEIQATLNGRSGGLLRERAGSIHLPEDPASNAEKYRVRSIVCA